jgi:hypothetical protein
MERKRVPYQRWGGGWILYGGCGHVGFAQLYVAVNAIVWVQLVPFVCRTCQWVSTVATAALDWPP